MTPAELHLQPRHDGSIAAIRVSKISPPTPPRSPTYPHVAKVVPTSVELNVSPLSKLNAKVGNPLGLAVLAAPRTKPMHPYEVAGLLRERGKDQDMRIKWGSLYTVVGNLEKHGFI